MKAKELVKNLGKDKLNNAEHSDFHASVYQYLKTVSSGSFNCTDAELKEYENAQQEEEFLLGRQTASVLTVPVQTADAGRDEMYSYFCSQVDSVAKCPIPDQKEAGRQLQLILKPFRGITEIPLAQENAELRSLIAQLRTPQVKKQVDVIMGLEQIINALEEANNKVVALMSERTGAEQEKAECKAKRSITDDCYDYIIQRVNSTLVLHSNPQVEQIKVEVDNLIDRTNAVYNQRIGIYKANEAKKKQTEQK